MSPEYKIVNAAGECFNGWDENNKPKWSADPEGAYPFYTEVEVAHTLRRMRAAGVTEATSVDVSFDTFARTPKWLLDEFHRQMDAKESAVDYTEIELRILNAELNELDASSPIQRTNAYEAHVNIDDRLDKLLNGFSRLECQTDENSTTTNKCKEG